MKLLLYSWQANNEQILADNLIKLGFEVVWFRKECRHYTRDMELAMEMIPCIHREGIEAVISFNYFPIISAICDTSKIPYYAWVYDCPHFTLYAGQVTLPCNHIGVFDKEMVRNLEKYGVKTVSHVPLSVDTDYFTAVIDKASVKEKEKYCCDISFVGSLYTDEHNYYDRFWAELADEVQVCPEIDTVKTNWEETIQKQCFCYEKDVLRDIFSSSETIAPGKGHAPERMSGLHGNLRELLEEWMRKHGLLLGEDYFAEIEDILLAVVLEKKVTVEERRWLLSEIASDFGGQYRFCLYTTSDLSTLPALRRHHKGIVDYHKQMPLVFAGSKINLNLSLRSIHSGIPLRVLDILACGGFVLTNFQPEITEFFREDEEIVIFRSLDECMEKIRYYLQNDTERKAIAAAGKRKVQEMFSYRNGLIKLLEG
ncbi:MAG: DUF3880 domain-containing protein [Roseburia sp.]|nr:DUF3880 domain-containing protein [Roseburia sp.]MCM1242761.1 DUF3880 domain-containing protein [Roseburia sp.]